MVEAASDLRPLRVLHCPDVVGGHAPQLARAERALGISAVSVTLQPSAYGYGADEVLFDAADGKVARKLKRVRLLARALRDFDVVHFNFGSSILPFNLHSGRPLLSRLYQATIGMRDLWLLKRAGKAVFVTYQGDDARQGDYCRAHFDIHFAHEANADYYSREGDEQKRAAIARFAAYADGIYALNPDLIHILPPAARFLPYANVDPAEWRPASTTSSDGPRLTIVHAPSHRAVKGTRYLLDAVEHLKAEGLKVELVLVENMNREAARKIYERAHIVVDQLLAGWYGGLAVESMALAKPVVAYIRDEDLRFIPTAMREELPVIRAEPGSIREVLKLLATRDRGRLGDIGMKGRAYVEKWHDPVKVASTVVADYRAALARKPSKLQ